MYILGSSGQRPYVCCAVGSADSARMYVAAHECDDGAFNVALTSPSTIPQMISAFKGHDDIVEYLLSRGAELDRRTNCGATALHFAAESGHESIVRLLLERGAALLPNELGLTPPLAAAERTQEPAVRLLLQHCPLSAAERVDVLELMGATFANDKDNYSLERSYELLREAMLLREAHGVPKRPGSPVAAYQNHRECVSLAELEAARGQPDRLHMESLVIRERVLGTANPEIPHSIIYRGAVFADSARFDRCLELWQRALTLKQATRVSAAKDLLRFAQVSAVIGAGADGGGRVCARRCRGVGGGGTVAYYGASF